MQDGGGANTAIASLVVRADGGMIGYVVGIDVDVLQVLDLQHDLSFRLNPRTGFLANTTNWRFSSQADCLGPTFNAVESGASCDQLGIVPGDRGRRELLVFGGDERGFSRPFETRVTTDQYESVPRRGAEVLRLVDGGLLFECFSEDRGAPCAKRIAGPSPIAAVHALPITVSTE